MTFLNLSFFFALKKVCTFFVYWFEIVEGVIVWSLYFKNRSRKSGFYCFFNTGNFYRFRFFCWFNGGNYTFTARVILVVCDKAYHSAVIKIFKFKRSIILYLLHYFGQLISPGTIIIHIFAYLIERAESKINVISVFNTANVAQL